MDERTQEAARKDEERAPAREASQEGDGRQSGVDVDDEHDGGYGEGAL